MLFYYLQMKMPNLSRIPPNMSSIGEICDSLGTVWLSSYGGNQWATGLLRLNSTPVKGGLINFPLFLLEGNAILPMTPKAGCAKLVQSESRDLRLFMYLSSFWEETTKYQSTNLCVTLHVSPKKTISEVPKKLNPQKIKILTPKLFSWLIWSSN